MVRKPASGKDFFPDSYIRMGMVFRLVVPLPRTPSHNRGRTRLRAPSGGRPARCPLRFPGTDMTSTDTSSPSRLQQLRELSVVVADTGDYDAIARLRPVDCTTNPTLVKKALDLPVYGGLIDRELAWARTQPEASRAVVDEVADRLTVGVGTMLSALVPGRVSTEVDADLAHDTAATVAKARKFMAMYAERGVAPEKILIKVAATWEGVEAARQLQAEGIDCNLTLIFNPTQAIACAEAGAFLISPFVGRILDWYKARGQVPATIDEDPGVKFVRGVYEEFKKRGAATVVMGA